MTRLCASLLAAGLALAACGPAAGQPVPYQFTPPPRIVPLPQAGTQPQIYTPPSSVAPLPPQSPRFVPAGNGRLVAVPPAPPYRDYGARLKGCIVAGAAAGMRAGQLGRFVARCAQ